ncbi:phage tail protein [Burkholderia stagnalis]|uniref:Tail fiber protein n=1 Tax=Burkholderia stagnalis TaxID=1503054 RepID=A0A106NPT2_9BURK|nr:phage tail protein [Burkholderia stagnalis]KVZ03390.1 hypothetical protein WT35_28265 [Burkholderia stagnalis]KWA48398.1 hypothetical protein WT43_32580 [Burkholderia stagnalis]KWA51725.1 hypothetical protein WT42_16740 [Burkholderia stagnalis]KWA62706.1 hypothetical protein WT44_13840 [Burkholderia stagnalis]KWC98345.1 hypothetical protein WT46_23825 [Burkholderia stagnalis]
MTIYQRPDEDVFADGARPGEVADFPNVVRGWGEAVDRTGGKPPMEWFNWLGLRTDRAIRYFAQRGVAEWSETERYPIHAIVQRDGMLYRALVERPSKPPEGNPKLWGALRGLTVPADDESESIATTRMVWAALRRAIDAARDNRIGEVVLEMRGDPKPGYLAINGSVLNRAAYPQLWAYAQTSGALVSEADWANGRLGCFSTGDGATTFRIPDFRGEFLRIWDGARGADVGRQLGSWQDSANRWHGHGASSGGAGGHGHTAWTDVQGWHGHHGWTGAVGDHQHLLPMGQNTAAYGGAWGNDGANNKFGFKDQDWDNAWFYSSPSGGHSHEFNTDGAGSHGHNIGVGWVDNHVHEIWVAGDGANEARPRNIAIMAFIRAYL